METIGFNCKGRIWPCGRVEANRERRTYEMHKYLGSQVCVASFVKAKARIEQNPLEYKLISDGICSFTSMQAYTAQAFPHRFETCCNYPAMHGCKMCEHYNATHPAPLWCGPMEGAFLKSFSGCCLAFLGIF